MDVVNTRKSPLMGVQPNERKKKISQGAAARGIGNYPNFKYHGGPLIHNPQIYIIFLGDWGSTANQNRSSRLSQFVTDLLRSKYMNILSQYGCGSSGKLVKSVFIPNANHNLSSSDIHNILQNAINNNIIPEPINGSNIVNIIYLDDATAIHDADASGVTLCEPTSDNAFGYHHFFITTLGNYCYFAVIPGLTDTCLKQTCPSDTGCSLHLVQTQEQRQTQVTSHEFSEMISDPQLNAWYDPDQNTGENGDICNGQSGTITVGPNTWTVQLMYSKLDDMNSNGNLVCIVSTANPLPPILPAPGRNVYVTNPGSNTISVIDTSTNAVTNTLTGGKSPWSVAIKPDGTKIYVTNYGSDNVSVIDTATKVITATITVGNNPWGVAVNPAGTKVYVTIRNKFTGNTVAVIDTATNTVVGTVLVGSNPMGVAVNPDGTKIYVANKNSDSVSVIDTATNTVTATVPVGNNPNGVVVNPDGTKVYVTNFQNHNVYVIDTSTNTVISTINVGLGPSDITMNLAGNKVYVANVAGSSISVIDTIRNTVVATISLQFQPLGIAVDAMGTRVYVANSVGHSLAVIDTVINIVITTIPVGFGANGVAVTSFAT